MATANGDGIEKEEEEAARVAARAPRKMIGNALLVLQWFKLKHI